MSLVSGFWSAALCLQVVTLLLHQHRSQEALAHFQQHMATYHHPPPQLAPVPLPAVAAHQGWVGRQYQVMGELMSSRVDPAHLPPQVANTKDTSTGTATHRQYRVFSTVCRRIEKIEKLFVDACQLILCFKSFVNSAVLSRFVL